jgi:hypothetical protein
MTDDAREAVVRAALALVRARQTEGLPRARVQELERVLEAAARRYWATL